MRVALALDEAHRLQNLLQEILLYAKPQQLNLEKLELNSWIQTILPTLREMPEAEARQIEFFPLSSTVDILIDRDKFKQVLINLVRNACEAIAPGEVVSCRIESQPQEVWISIHNQGEPIPTELLSKLTQPFCSGKPGGTGLGLAIVKRIVDAHGGSLSIQSDALKGTKIKIKLPLN
jgi:signal transduction histidine kinase